MANFDFHDFHDVAELQGVFQRGNIQKKLSGIEAQLLIAILGFPIFVE